MYRRSPAESDHLLYYPQFRNICQAGILIYFSVIYFSEKVAQNSYRVFGEEDYQTYKEMHYVKSQLKDIAEHGSLDDERILVYCQPVRNVHTGTYDTAESLMRLRLPQTGLVFPDRFIPLAEKYGYIHRLSMIILNKTCRQIKQMQDEGYQISRVSVNLSVEELGEKDFMEEFKIPAYDEVKHKGLVRHVLLRYGFKTDEIMVCLVINGKTIPHCHDLVGRLRQIPGMTSITLSTNTAKTNVIMGDTIRLLWGQEFITDYIGEIKYQISPLSFYQVNPVQTEKLYGLALDYAGLTGNEAVWDLYCGIGTISLFLAKKAKQVYGVEIVPQAIDDARNNAKINDITNAEFYVGKAEEVLPEYYKEYEKTHNGETAHADVIVVDPPRKGCEESLLQTIVDMQPEKVVYVSCDSATLARDVKFLRANGYELKDVTPVDQFPHTVHVEVVCCLHRVNS